MRGLKSRSSTRNFRTRDDNTAADVEPWSQGRDRKREDGSHEMCAGSFVRGLGSPLRAGYRVGAKQHHRNGARFIGRRAAGRHHRGKQPRAHRAGPIGRLGRSGPLSGRRSPSGSLHDDLHVARFYDRQAYRHRIACRVHRHGGRRTAARQRGGNDHSVR